jgi:hypothetical protein
MKTIQLAVHDAGFAKSLEDLLVQDGSHRVYRVENPDLRLDGVVVVDSNQLGDFAIFDREPERFVVVTPKGSDRLAKIWDAGVRHVVFEGDSASTAHLAVIAAEMRLPRPAGRNNRGSALPPSVQGHHAFPHPSFPIVELPPRCGHCQSSRCHHDF